MNDPNALVRHNDEWRLFAQYRDDAPAFARTHWGHWSSPDLLRWRFEAIAIAAEPDGYAYSGCVLPGHPLTAFHTSHDPATGAEWQVRRQSQDGGARWSAPEPVLGQALPNRRDPFVWTRPDGSRRLLLARPGDWHDVSQRGELELWSSAIGDDWREIGRIGPFSPPGVMWEVPLIVERGDGTAALVVSMVDRRDGGARSSAYYWIGRFDGTSFERLVEAPRALDLGSDFYAAIPFPVGTGGGLLGWVGDWQTARAFPWPGFAGGPISLPRSVTWRGEGSAAWLAQQAWPGLAAAFDSVADGVPVAGLGTARFENDAVLLVEGAGCELRVEIAGDGVRARRSGADWLAWEVEHAVVPDGAGGLELFVDGPVVELFFGGHALTTALPADGPFAVRLEGAGRPIAIDWRVATGLG